MKITIWDLIKYLYKHKIFIVLTVICSFVLSKLYVDKVQTYSAEVVIRYKDSCVSEGNSLDGSKFDVNEIVSPKVIANANKDLLFNVTDDGIRANTKITPIIPSSISSLKDAKEKLGEEYEYHPNTFKITYKGNGSYYQTRDTLDKLVDNYFKYYNEKYLYLASVSEIDYDLNKGNYEYLEQAEILQNNIDNTIDILKSYVSENEYRSPTTGLTFTDLINEFEYLSEFELPLIYSRIYTAKLAINKDLMLKKYNERKEASELKEKNSSEKAGIAEDRMDAYVDANVDVPNSYNSNKNVGNDDVTIIQDIHDEERVTNEQTTYDSLIKNYVTDSVSANDSKIDAEYCVSVIDAFTGDTPKGINYEEYENLVKSDISNTLDKLKELYSTAFSLIDDFNAYIPSMHIESLTGIRYFENVYASLYNMIGMILGLFVSCAAAIAIEIMRKYAEYEKSKDDADINDIMSDYEKEELVATPVIPDLSDGSINEDT